jgi:glucose-6-phosphate 1-dehydrogenase
VARATLEPTRATSLPGRDGAPDPCAIVIFGASGDLTRRMLLPALYNLFLDGRLPDRFAVIGFARTAWSDEEFRQHAHASVREFSRRPLEESVFEQFARRLYYVAGEYANAESHTRLATLLEHVEGEHDTDGNHLFYLALPPSASEEIIEMMGRTGQVISHREGDESGGWSRLIVEKPFGDDLESATRLNRIIHTAFREEDVFRIDHYLGKENHGGRGDRGGHARRLLRAGGGDAGYGAEPHAAAAIAGGDGAADRLQRTRCARREGEGRARDPPAAG